MRARRNSHTVHHPINDVWISSELDPVVIQKNHSVFTVTLPYIASIGTVDTPFAFNIQDRLTLLLADQ